MAFVWTPKKYAYLLRLNPDRGEYNLYCYCYRRDWLDQHLKDAEKGIRFIDSHYKELFRIPDGGKVKIHYCGMKSRSAPAAISTITMWRSGSNPITFASLPSAWNTAAIPASRGSGQPARAVLQRSFRQRRNHYHQARRKRVTSRRTHSCHRQGRSPEHRE